MRRSLRTRSQRPASSIPGRVVRRDRRPKGLRLDAGVISARKPAKLSQVTLPAAASSSSAFSHCVRKSPVSATISLKNDAPRSTICRHTISAAPPHSAGSSLPTAAIQAAASPRGMRASGVVFKVPVARDGVERLGVSRNQVQRPDAIS